MVLAGFYDRAKKRILQVKVPIRVTWADIKASVQITCGEPRHAHRPVLRALQPVHVMLKGHSRVNIDAPVHTNNFI